jgi:hypothetical protein
LRLTRKKIGLALALFALAVPVAALPSMASAASPSTTKSKEKKQNKKISTINRNLLDLAGSVGSLRTGTDRLITELGSASADVATLKALSSALPPILSALGNGLTAVGNGLKALVPFTKQTYVAVQPTVGASPSPANAAAACFVETPQLPITGNSAFVTEECLATDAAGVPLSGPVRFWASCRSSKTNGGVCARVRLVGASVSTAVPASAVTFNLGSPLFQPGGPPVTTIDLGRNTLVYPAGDTAGKNAFAASLFSGVEGGVFVPGNAGASFQAGNDIGRTLAGGGSALTIPGPAPAVIRFTVFAVDPEPDLTDKSPQLT